MSIRIDTNPLIAGAAVVGTPGLGVRAETIPSSGDNGPSILYNDIALPADAGKEIRAQVTTWPSGGALDIGEDGGFTYTGPSGSFRYQLYVDGVAVGAPATVTLNVGTPPAVLPGYPNPADVRAGVVYGPNGEYVGTLVV